MADYQSRKIEDEFKTLGGLNSRIKKGIAIFFFCSEKITGSTKALPFQLLLPYRLINHKLCFRNLSFSEKNPTKQINKLTWVSFSPQVINMSKVVPPGGPPGHNGTQGPVGSPGPSGPRGSPGPGANLSLCYYRRKQNRSLTSDKKPRATVSVTEQKVG